MARAELDAGAEEVALLYANRYLRDRIMQDELQQLQRDFPAGRFRLQDLVSREPELVPADPSAAGSANAWHGRPSTDTLARCFPWELADGPRFLVVGTKAMKSDVYAMFRGLGFGGGTHLLKKQMLPRAND